MNLSFSQGRIIANQHELVVRLNGDARITLQAMIDDIRFIKRGTVITASGSGVNWSVCLDNDEQFDSLIEFLGVAPI